MVQRSGSRRHSTLVVLLVTTSICWGAGVDAEEAAPSIEAQIEALGALDPATRIDAARALGRTRDPASVGPLSQVLRSDPSPEVRGWAARALGMIGTAEARAALSSAAQRDGDERVRGLCAQLLGQVATSPFEGQGSGPPSPTYSDQGVGQGPLEFRPVRRRTGLGFVIAGWGAFGLTYLACLIGGSAAYVVDDDAGTWPLFLPAVGPIIQAGFVFSDEPDEWGWDPTPNAFGVLALVDALGQIAGITLAAIGHVRRARWRQSQSESGQEEGADDVEAGEDEPPPEASRGFTIGLLPGSPGDGPGVILAGTF